MYYLYKYVFAHKKTKTSKFSRRVFSQDWPNSFHEKLEK